ncbi:DUF2058 domain-containing protein [Aliikangiella coralliicola]|uniref:DUF2058 domain-containing protein n=1 Tax=Aliikangiella coralliicola TaxID=2592383 RepID=A0A545UAM4_9GAMM|nr:DUF2058 domain-containing protein [Aliikangiella coralliicola]TQV86509.1 DUF2058 domain-containing protein [Aliikangiella coralliicola]
MSSLQEQLLKAGLTSKDKVNKVNSAKRKQNKINRKHKIEQVDENKLEAEKALAEQAERARQLNQEKNAKAEEKAIVAQIKQLIEVNQQVTGKPVVSFNFSDCGSIKKLEVSNEVHRYLTNGKLAIARFDEQYYLVPPVVAEKIKERSEDYVVLLNDKVEETDEDDPYAEYQIPDDLMW